jgi:hypothetical protein
MTIVSGSFRGSSAITTTPKTNKPMDTMLPILMVHLVRGSLDKAIDLIILVSAGSMEALI